MTKARASTAANFSAFMINVVIRSLLAAALAMPYRWRVPFVGWVASHVVAPVAGYRRRIRQNLHYTFPDMAAADIDRIVRRVPNNMGRVMIEIFSGDEFVDRIRNIPMHGAGVKRRRICDQ
ncbi:MAG: hypothetical protein IID14_04010 [Candidatus Marinimicrobia bacterium]|nr:hypothetical protein [Candidatus Neomarinimicrobiota bacterium]